MVSRVGIALLLVALTAEAAPAGHANSTNGASLQLASDSGSDVQRQACTPDVFRLCGQFIPDAGAIVGCLRVQRPSLSPACRAVFR
jgi:hypothetical protein